MPKCPECNTEVFFLDAKAKGTTMFEYHSSDNYDVLEAMESEFYEFRCPECGSVLFDNESEAEQFMKEDED